MKMSTEDLAAAMKVSTEDLVAVLRLIAKDLQSPDGVANVFIDGAANRMTLLANLVAKHVEEREAANQRIKRLEEALKCLTLVVGLTPIAGNKNALQEAMDIAIAELQAKEAKL